MDREDIKAVINATLQWGLGRVPKYHLRLTRSRGHASVIWNIVARKYDPKHGLWVSPLKYANISIPKWAIAQGEDFAIAYTVHEACHVIARLKGHDYGHGLPFQMLENDALTQWGLSIDRGARSAYATAVYNGPTKVWPTETSSVKFMTS